MELLSKEMSISNRFLYLRLYCSSTMSSTLPDPLRLTKIEARRQKQDLIPRRQMLLVGALQ